MSLETFPLFQLVQKFAWHILRSQNGHNLVQNKCFNGHDLVKNKHCFWIKRCNSLPKKAKKTMFKSCMSNIEIAWVRSNFHFLTWVPNLPDMSSETQMAMSWSKTNVVSNWKMQMSSNKQKEHDLEGSRCKCQNWTSKEKFPLSHLGQKFVWHVLRNPIGHDLVKNNVLYIFTYLCWKYLYSSN